MRFPSRSRRSFLRVLSAAPFAPGFAQAALQTQAGASRTGDTDPGDWVCPMDPDVRATKPGKCPRCGMTLKADVPDRVEYIFNVTHTPAVIKPGSAVILKFEIIDPASGKGVRQYSLVHEKLIHLFVVSADLSFFAHVHPQAQPDGTFELSLCLPQAGMYRLLADYYPSNSLPQLSLDTLFVQGKESARMVAKPMSAATSLPITASNLQASVHSDPQTALAGLESKLFYSLTPADNLQPYLGAWGHMLVASEDLIDLIHTHPFLSDPAKGNIQFNVIFPRPGHYRIWTQFQRAGTVNTVPYDLQVASL